ncbi:MAG TPA: aspartyl/asparaginyl beta-hydroxylase domain-containing protein [Chiayiivirga sp.]|nr:aspartyl/asparaginyl beta-hydroxylase domain-containing protein [Chiayiivirga sp.]
MSMEPVDTLIQRAEQAIANGGVLSAMADLRRALQIVPGHARAASRLADLLMQQTQWDEAVVLLNEALRNEPSFAPAHVLLARCAMGRGDSEAALASLNRAILYDNSAWGARIEKAQLLEALGRPREAALGWQEAASSIPAALRESPRMRGVMEHAQSVVTQNLAQLRDHLMDDLGEAMRGESDADLRRFHHALDIATGRRGFVVAEPVFFPFPRLPAIPFFERDQFPWAEEVESHWQGIREELLGVMNHDEAGFDAYVQTREGQSSAQFAPLDRNKAWSAYFLWKHGQRIDAHCQACPTAASAIEAAPLPRIRARAPAAFFSRLDPGVHIPPHNGATNARLTVHLPLIVPDNCRFRVGDETRQWQEGTLLLFDDTIRHEAWNGSDRQRVVMIFDIWNPFLTELERSLVTRAIEGLVSFYGDHADLGEL